jgi:hypothetical protein
MNTHLFNAFTQVVQALEASAGGRLDGELARNLHVDDRRELMQWGTEGTRYLLLATAAGTLLTRLECSTEQATLARDAIEEALEEETAMRAFFIDGARIREIDLQRAIERLAASSPYGVTHSGANSGLLSRDGAEFASWILRPVLQSGPDFAASVTGAFTLVSTQWLRAAEAASTTADGKRRGGRPKVVPPEIVAADRVKLADADFARLAAAAATPTHCLTIQLLAGARDALSQDRLRAIGDLAQLAADMVGRGHSRPLVRVQVQIGDVPLDEFLQQLNPDGHSWEAMAQRFASEWGNDPEREGALHLALQDPSQLPEEDWAQLCAEICPGSPLLRAPVFFERDIA